MTVGCMYAGKTSALIRNKPVGETLIIDYDVCETPYSSTLHSHNEETVNCIKTDDLSKIDVRIFDNIMINEEWKTINDCDYYEISSHGRVRNKMNNTLMHLENKIEALMNDEAQARHEQIKKRFNKY
jgi:hypothetical protein